MSTQLDNLVLVIEDDDTLLDALYDIFDTIGLNVIGTRNGRDGIAAYKTHQKDIQLVVLDLRIPDMHGADVLKTLRAINPRVKALISSASDENSIRKSIAGQPDVPIIRKPYDLRSFLSKVQGILEV